MGSQKEAAFSDDSGFEYVQFLQQDRDSVKKCNGELERGEI
jgi:hypothetical protein